jgi:small subunit ribosomal protein S20
MPNTQSAKKALRESRRRHAQNLAKNKAWKETTKKFKRLAVTNKKEAAEYLKEVFQKLDKAAKTNAMSRNKASRLKSRLSKKLASVSK